MAPSHTLHTGLSNSWSFFCRLCRIRIHIRITYASFFSLSEQSEAKITFYIRYIRHIRLISTPEHIFHAITSFLSVGNSAVRKNEQFNSPQDSRMSSIGHERTWASERNVVPEALLMSLERPSYCWIVWRFTPASSLNFHCVSLLFFLRTYRRVGGVFWRKKKKVQKKSLPHKHSKRTNQRHIQPQKATRCNILIINDLRLDKSVFRGIVIVSFQGGRIHDGCGKLGMMPEEQQSVYRT